MSFEWGEKRLQGFPRVPDGSFRKLGVPYFGVLIIKILLFRVLYLGPLFSNSHTGLGVFEGLGVAGLRGAKV